MNYSEMTAFRKNWPNFFLVRVQQWLTRENLPFIVIASTARPRGLPILTSSEPVTFTVERGQFSMIDDRIVKRKKMREELAELKNAAITELERRGYEVRGKTPAQIRQILKRRPAKQNAALK